MHEFFENLELDSVFGVFIIFENLASMHVFEKFGLNAQCFYPRRKKLGL